jgi:hypothetical protein
MAWCCPANVNDDMNGSAVDGDITVFFFHAVMTCGVDDIGMVASGFVVL